MNQGRVVKVSGPLVLASFDPTLFQAAQKARPLVQVRRLDIKHVRGAEIGRASCRERV